MRSARLAAAAPRCDTLSSAASSSGDHGGAFAVTRAAHGPDGDGQRRVARVRVSRLYALDDLGPQRLAASSAPLVDVVRGAGPLAGWSPVVQVGAAVAALGVLLSLIAGVGRTAFAMSHEGDLPPAFGRVSTGSRVPYVAELAVGVVVVIVVLAADVRGAIGFSSFAVLVYYAVANASAYRLRPDRGQRWSRIVAVLGLVGCAVLAVTLPLLSVLAGILVVAVGMLGWRVARVRGVPG